MMEGTRRSDLEEQKSKAYKVTSGEQAGSYESEWNASSIM